MSSRVVYGSVTFDKVIEAMIDELLKLDGLRVQYTGFAVVLQNDATSRSILRGALQEGIRRTLPPQMEFDNEEKRDGVSICQQ